MNGWTPIARDNMERAAMTEASVALLRALWREHRDIMVRLGALWKP